MRKSQHFYNLKYTELDTLLTLNGSTIKVFLALARHANWKDGTCFPGYRKMSEMTGVTSRRRLKEHVDILMDVGLVQSRWKEGDKYHYMLK